MSDDFEEDLIELGLQRYVPALLSAGYNDWDMIGDMTESDFEALNFRLGDRRKLQREMARRQLWPENSPLPTADELREFTLSLQETGGDGTKNGYFDHHVVETIESDRVSPDNAGGPAADESELNSQDEASENVSEMPESSDFIPSVDLDPHVMEHRTTEGNAPIDLSINDMDFDDDNSPTAVDSHVVSFTVSFKKYGSLL